MDGIINNRKFNQEDQHLLDIIREEKERQLRIHVDNINLKLPDGMKSIPYDKTISSCIKLNKGIINRYNKNSYRSNSIVNISHTELLKDIVNLYLYCRTLEYNLDNLEDKYNIGMSKSKKDFDELLNINNDIVKNNKSLKLEIKQKDKKFSNFLIFVTIINVFLTLYVFLGLDRLLSDIKKLHFVTGKIFETIFVFFEWIVKKLISINYDFLSNINFIIIMCIMVTMTLFYFIRKNKKD